MFNHLEINFQNYSITKYKRLKNYFIEKSQ